MGLQYVLLFGANGVSLPFAGLWFHARGLDGAEIGALLAAPMLGRLVTGRRSRSGPTDSCTGAPPSPSWP
jgi:hypothetical protein